MPPTPSDAAEPDPLRMAVAVWDALDETGRRRIFGRLDAVTRTRIQSIAASQPTSVTERRSAIRQMMFKVRPRAGGDDELQLSPALTGNSGRRSLDPPARFPNDPSGPPAGDRRTTAGDRRTTASGAFAFLETIDIDAVVATLSQESAQTAALICVEVSPRRAADILRRLDPARRSEVVTRIGRMGQVPPEILAETAAHLRQRLVDRSDGPGEALRRIMEQMEAPENRPAAPRVANRGPTASAEAASIASGDRTDTGDEVATLSFTDAAAEAKLSDPASLDPRWDDRDQRYLVGLPPATLAQGLGRLPKRSMLLALCGLPHDVVRDVLGLLPKPRSRQIRQEMHGLSSIGLSEIDAAKKELSATLRPTSAAA